jgi:hypothetical protein
LLPRLLLLGRSLVGAALAYTANHRPRGCPYRRAFPRIATDGATHGTYRGATCSAFDRSTLLRWRPRLTGLLGNRDRIDARVLLRPDLTLTEVGLLALLTLSLGGIENRLLGHYRPCHQKDGQSGCDTRR